MKPGRGERSPRDGNAVSGAEFAGIGLQFEVQTVWSCPSDNSNYTLCGAAIEADQSAATANTWRAIVDRLSA